MYGFRLVGSEREAAMFETLHIFYNTEWALHIMGIQQTFGQMDKRTEVRGQKSTLPMRALFPQAVAGQRARLESLPRLPRAGAMPSCPPGTRYELSVRFTLTTKDCHGAVFRADEAPAAG